MASIDDILLYQAQLDALDREDNTDAALLGALIGGGAGYTVGSVETGLSDALNTLKDAAAKRKGMTRSGLPTGTKVRAALKRATPRFAGGLTGAVLGGSLGVAAERMQAQDSLAATLAAKRLSGEPLNEMETRAMQALVAGTLSNNTIG